MRAYYVSVSLLAVSLITLLIIINQQRNIEDGVNAIIIAMIIGAIGILSFAPTIKHHWKHHRDMKLSQTLKRNKTWK